MALHYLLLLFWPSCYVAKRDARIRIGCVSQIYFRSCVERALNFFVSFIGDSQVSLDLLVTPASRPMPMQQHQPHEASDRVSEHQSHLQHPTSLTSSLRITPSGPSSKAAPLYILSPPGDSPPVTDSHSPPGYEE